MKSVLHILFHDWGQWSKPFIPPQLAFWRIQRSCKICNKSEWKIIE